VLVAAIASFAIGGLWYSVLFGKKWQAEMGFTPESMQNMKMSAQKAYAGFLVIALVSAYVLAHFVQYLGVIDVSGALQLAFWIWLGFALPIIVGALLWENRSWTLVFINGGYQLVSLGAMAIILTLWR